MDTTSSTRASFDAMTKAEEVMDAFTGFHQGDKIIYTDSQGDHKGVLGTIWAATDWRPMSCLVHGGGADQVMLLGANSMRRDLD